jgi:hypothetical protein
MLRHLKSPTAFYAALRENARDWLALSEQQFNSEWKKVDASFDKDWISMTSSFNVDTWLIECVEEVFPTLKNRRKDVERLFFGVRGEGDFGPHLIGKEMPWKDAEGGKVKIVQVSLSHRLGMRYGLRDSSGRFFEIEKFD